jgi:hypothetical protein
VAGIEMRLEAGARMVERADLRDVEVVHPDTGELVLITQDDVLTHAEADDRALEAAERYEGRGRTGTGASFALCGRTAMATRPSSQRSSGRPPTWASIPRAAASMSWPAWWSRLRRCGPAAWSRSRPWMAPGVAAACLPAP